VNYYNYFTEVEEHFQRKRGALVYISPVDWALIASWRDAGIPLAAVIAGIDQAFEKFESGRRRDTGRRRSLLYCAPAVLEAAEAMRAAAAGAPPEGSAPPPSGEGAFSRERLLAHLRGAAAKIAATPALDAAAPGTVEIRDTLERLIAGISGEAGPAPKFEELDRVLTVLDDKLYWALLQGAPVEVLAAVRGELAGELAPYRRKLRADQLQTIENQFVQRRLLERAALPRLSLFYMAL